MKRLLIIIFFFIIPAIAFPDESDYKIGPLLHDKINNFQQKNSRQPFSLQEQTIDNQEPSEELFKVIVVMDRDHLSELSQSLVDELEIKVKELRGHIGNHAFNNVQVWIPLEKVNVLAEWEEIKIIKIPTKPGMNSGSVQSEGFDIGNVNNWNSNGITGQGVKVGVLDSGFLGADDLLGTELPSDTTAFYTGTTDDFYSTEHGTACAEIVHDVAPGAKMFLVNVSDMDVGYSNVIRWLKEQNVHIISSSIAYKNLYMCELVYNITKYDSQYAVSQIQPMVELKDQINKTVSNTVAGGIIFSQAANNNGRQRWKGYFNDTDSDGDHNFSPNQNYNEFVFQNYDTIGKDVYAVLMWSDELTYDDYDLYIYNTYGIVTSSTRNQKGDFPIGLEACKFKPILGLNYYIYIENYSATPQELVLLIGTDTFAHLKNHNSKGTVNLGTPSGNPDVITVGAVPYNSTSTIEDFSGQGPGDNDVIKPDLVAPDGVSTMSYEGAFYGTSAAAPHVAGVAALVKQMYPSYSPQQIKSYLESNAKNLGSPGKDNVFGSGLVQLPPINNSLSGINAQITGLKFYETPSGGIPYEQRNYSNSFKQDTTRYVAYEIGLEYPSPNRLVELPITVRYFYPDGSLMGELFPQINIQPNWTYSYHYWSWGESEPGNWDTGTYTVKFFEGDQEIISGNFRIDQNYNDREQIEAFVSRFYEVVLGRSTEAGGLTYWTNSLMNRIRAGADVAREFIFSQEFTNKQLDNASYLNVLYSAFYDRLPDPGGYSYWLDRLNNGESRDTVLGGFIWSQEFSRLCQAYSINAVK